MAVAGKNVMQTKAKIVSNNDLGAILAYLKGKDALADQDTNENKPVSTETKQGSYLKINFTSVALPQYK